MITIQRRNNTLFGVPLKAVVLVSMVFLFVAGHVYVSSQPISAVLMAEIMEEHEEHGDTDFDDCANKPFSGLTILKLKILETGEEQLLGDIAHPPLKGHASEDPPPPRF